MQQQNFFSNDNILNSAVLSNMVYIEGQLLYECKSLQQKYITEEKTHKFINENSIENINYQSTTYLEQYIKLFLEKLIQNEEYDKIILQRIDFYKKFTTDLKLEQLPNETIYEIAKQDCIIDTYKEISLHFKEILKIKNKSLIDFLDEINKTTTRIHFLEDVSENKSTLIKDTSSFWQKFSPLEFSEDLQKKYQSYEARNESNVNTKFSNGYIEAGKNSGIKDACLLMGYVKENNADTLYISFRGTENKAKSPLWYFLENYPNMERQYNYFEPILKDIIKEEIVKHKEKHPNKPLNIVFAGHSLGAALAEKALDKFKNTEDINYKGIFLANPGSFHYLQGAINKLDKWQHQIANYSNKNNNKFLKIGSSVIEAEIIGIKVVILLLVGVPKYLLGTIDVALKPLIPLPEKLENTIAYATLGIPKFLNIGLSLFFNKTRELGYNALSFIINKKQADERGLTINHERDNIPLIGKALFQNSNPQKIDLTDLIPEVESSKNPWKKIVHFRYHSMENYYSEVKNLIQDKSDKLDNIRKIREKMNKNNSTIDVSIMKG